MTNWEFPASGPIDLVIHLLAGDVTVTAEPTELITVSLDSSQRGDAGNRRAAGVRVEHQNGRLEIIEPKRSGFILRHDASLKLAVTVPTGSRCEMDTAAAAVTCRGELGSLRAKNGSGDISAATVTGPAELRTASGNVRVDDAGDRVSVHTGAGNIELGHAGGDVVAEAATGDIKIGYAGASATARTSSGNVRITSIRSGHADVTTVVGNVYVGVPPGIGVYLDLASVTGRVSSDLQPSDSVGEADLRIKGRTLRGNLQVARAALADTAR